MSNWIYAKSAGSPLVIARCDGGLEVAEAKEGESRAVNIKAYNGGLLFISGFPYPVVANIGGMDTEKKIPFLIDHVNHPSQTLGQGKASKTGGALPTVVAEGIITGASEDVTTLLASADNGHTFQASIGIRFQPDAVTIVKAKQTLQANGRSFTGPVVYIANSELVEISAVTIGGDREGTEVNIGVAASLGLPQYVDLANKRGATMKKEFLEWAAATFGMSEEFLNGLEAKQLEGLQAQFAASQEKKPEENKPAKAAASIGAPSEDVVALQAKVAEMERVDGIKSACGADFSELQARAIDGGWTVDQAKASIEEVKKIRDARPSAPGIITGSADIDQNQVLEAAMCLRYGQMDDEKLTASYGEKVLDEADKMRRIGLKETIRAACQYEGKNVPKIGASEYDWASAAFSTRTIPSVLLNSANKMMMDSFSRRESVAVQISRKLSASDFKTHTGVRLVAGGNMKKVGNGGQLEDGTIEDANFTYDIDTYGEILGVSRQDLINDDLGAFMAIPEQIGFDAWQLREELFFTLLLSNPSSFYATANGNYQEGTTTALNSDSLGAAVTLFEKQTDGKGRAIALKPEILLTPSELKQTSQGFYTSELLITGEDATTTDRNVHRNLYRPLSTPFLSNSGITGYSALGWYLFADPRILASFGIAYLGGREAPIIEETDTDPRYLGKTWRGYYDVGVCTIDEEASVFSKGKA